MNRLVNLLLRHAPHWLLDLVDWMLQRDSALIRWVKQRAAAGLPVPEPVRPDPGAEARVFFGPFNYAGQAWQWARSLEAADARVSAENLTVTFPNDLGFESDDRVPSAVFAGSQQWQSRQREAFAAYTHVVVESFTSTLGWGRGAGLEREIAWHRSQGRMVALLCHGTDIRSPRRHRERSAHSPFALMDRADERLERRAAQNRRVMQAFDGPVYFSTPDLVHDVPQGIWLPLVIEPARWERAAERSGVVPGRRAAPVVLHAPTSTRMKGTEAVVAAAQRLGPQIEYRPLSGVPASEMPDRIAGADIVVDQLLLGSYGVAACEAMAAGRVVVGNVDAEVREAVRAASGLELPIVQADPSDLAEVLARLAAAPQDLAELGERGAAFVRAVHAGGGTLPAMREFLRLD